MPNISKKSNADKVTFKLNRDVAESLHSMLELSETYSELVRRLIKAYPNKRRKRRD